jgi:hypothetical protein
MPQIKLLRSLELKNLKNKTSSKTRERNESLRKNKWTAILSSTTKSSLLPLAASEIKDPHEPKLNLRSKKSKKGPLPQASSKYPKNPKASSTSQFKNLHKII